MRGKLAGPLPQLAGFGQSTEPLDAKARGAIIIGGNRLALGVVRSLGRRGIPTWVLTDEQVIAGYSRYAVASLPWPYEDKSLQLRFLLDLADRESLHGAVLIPSNERDAVFISRNHQALSQRFRLTTPAWDIAKWACDKRLSNELAARVGVAHPWTLYSTSRDELANIECPYPVILKPTQKEEGSFFARVKALRADNRTELLSQFDEAARMAGPLEMMVQEMVPGGGEAQFSFAALCDEGVPLASLTARRTRQWPIDFGVASSFVETVENPAVEDAGRRLLEGMRYSGLVEVEFKFDERTGQYKLLDINPRVWGWHSIGHRAGVDFPYLLWRMVHGFPVPTIRGRAGVSWVRVGTDVPAAAQLIRQGRLSIGNFFRSYARMPEPAVLAADDPLPAALDSPLQAVAYLRRRLGSATRPAR